MKMLVLPALAAALLLGSASLTPGSAAPVGTMPIAAPDSAVDPAAYRKRRTYRKRMYRKRMYRGSSRMYAPSQAGNARNPERPIYQQGQGTTTGGPRF